MSARLSPSILSCDFGRLADQIAAVERGGADMIHVDVMDGHFVPNITIGPLIVAAARRATTLPLDVHLMIEEPDRYLEAFADAGASIVSVHVEIVPHLHRTLGRIRELGLRAGAAINPATPVDAIRDVVTELDHLIVMSVNPGFGGQKFIPHSIAKVENAARLLQSHGSDAAIEVDGGVDTGNAAELVRNGATVLVAGASIYGTPDPEAATRALRAAAEGR